jgi:K+-sensing histidine kinase KdpD
MTREGRAGPSALPSSHEPSSPRDRSTIVEPWVALAIGGVGVGLITLALVPLGEDLTRAAPALLLLVPVVVAGVLGGRTVAAVTTGVAAFAFATGFLPPIGSPAAHLADDVVALGMFVIVAGMLGVVVATFVGSERRRLATEQARADALAQVDEQRAALLRSVSHDLRSPLSTIRAAATDLDSGVEHGPDERRELLTLVIDESERLDRLVANLLSMSRIEAGALEPHREPVDLSELIEACIARLSRLLHRVRVDVSIEPDMPLVPVDYTLVDQVLSNLLENAARHSPPGGHVRVSCATDDDVVVIAVTDEGPGVPPKQRSSIFEPFSGADDHGTTGIGLAICRSVAEAHGGSIDVGDAPSGGACFSLRLPIHV